MAKHNPQDATLRNVRAARTKVSDLKRMLVIQHRTLVEIDVRVQALERRNRRTGRQR